MFKNILDKIASKNCLLRRRLSPLEAEISLKQSSVRVVRKLNYLRGFTLVELMAVVLIIGILVVIAIPNYERAVEQSRDAEAFTGLKAILTAQEMYALKYEAYALSLNSLNINVTDPGKYFDFNLVGGAVPLSVANETIANATTLTAPTRTWRITELGYIYQ